MIWNTGLPRGTCGMSLSPPPFRSRRRPTSDYSIRSGRRMFGLERPPMPQAVALAGFSALGQVECQKTPEGGTVCSDGTYHPPGCPNTPGAQGTVESSKFPIVPVAIGAVAIAGLVLFLGRS